MPGKEKVRRDGWRWDWRKTIANDLERAVARHYGRSGLLERILAGFEASGIDPNHLKPKDLAPVDEFHIGGREATRHAVAPLGLDASAHVLDVGCGLGGAARYMASEFGCAVTGIDLTPDYINVARALADMTGLNRRVRYDVASATDMPFEATAFDAAITLHVAMNIPDREKLYAEVARVLKPGAPFCVYDVMGSDVEGFAYPVPWAETEATSHLTDEEEMRELLANAGFAIEHEENRRAFALDFFRERLANAAGRPPPIGLHLILGKSARKKFENTLANIENGYVSPVLMIARKRIDN